MMEDIPDSRSAGAVFPQTGRGDGGSVPISVHDSTDWSLYTDLFGADLVGNTAVKSVFDSL